MKIVIGIMVLVVLFIIWRYGSVARGMKKRDEQIFLLLDPVAEKLASGSDVSTEEIESLAQMPYVRPLLYALLKDQERLDLFPKQYRTEEQQAQALLAYWMMHPNELQDKPDQIAVIQKVSREIEGQPSNFYVMRYHMAEGHWAAEDGWLLGVAGPFFQQDVPYSGYPGAFSRVGDQQDKVTPEELVDWFIDMVQSKKG